MKIRYTLLALAVMATSAVAGNFDLKGYRLGDPMNACPAGSSARPNKEFPSETVCRMSGLTLANTPTEYVEVSFQDGHISTVLFSFPRASGRYAYSEVKDALIQKFGTPLSAKEHVNEYMWMSGEEVLGFDGWRGSLILFDRSEYKRNKANAAQKNKSDI